MKKRSEKHQNKKEIGKYGEEKPKMVQIVKNFVRRKRFPARYANEGACMQMSPAHILAACSLLSWHMPATRLSANHVAPPSPQPISARARHFPFLLIGWSWRTFAGGLRDWGPCLSPSPFSRPRPFPKPRPFSHSPFALVH